MTYNYCPVSSLAKQFVVDAFPSFDWLTHQKIASQTQLVRFLAVQFLKTLAL